MDTNLGIAVDHDSDLPPYEQIVTSVTDAIRTGRLTPGTKLPPVRTLASGLGLAANTVAKAYRRLETEGWVETKGRNGTVVRERPTSDGEYFRSAVNRLIVAAERQRMELPDTLQAVQSAWGQKKLGR